VDDRQSRYFRKLAIKPQKYRENKNALQINKQNREKQASKQASSLARVMAFFTTVFHFSMNLRTTQTI
jgi:hypothetical protein